MPADKNLYLHSLTDKGDTAKNLRLRSEAEKISAKIRNLKARVGGVWTAITKVSVRVAGAWVEATMSAKAAGDWKVIHEK